MATTVKQRGLNLALRGNAGAVIVGNCGQKTQCLWFRRAVIFNPATYNHWAVQICRYCGLPVQASLKSDRGSQT
jgi:hypothetical protein